MCKKYISPIPGVTKTTAGYANGETETPTYEDVCSRGTGHAETVEIVYDGNILPLTRLLDLYAEVSIPLLIIGRVLISEHSIARVFITRMIPTRR